ncbi:hypothetical protein NKH36_16885 [Mesorhizobium sp. M1312]|uniref:hypothetical protein n=1 Tax=unclassified Mesorhizobium TaxID=325217 RepID=UPI0033374FEB
MGSYVGSAASPSWCCFFLSSTRGQTVVGYHAAGENARHRFFSKHATKVSEPLVQSSLRFIAIGSFTLSWPSHSHKASLSAYHVLAEMQAVVAG